MTDSPPLKILFAAGAVLLLLLGIADAVWLTMMGDAFYRPQLGTLLAPAPVLWAAAAFYLLYAAGVTAFVLRPALTIALARDIYATARVAVFWPGAFFGFVAYGVYDLTSLATLRDWPVAVTVVDMLWGALLTGVSAALALRLVLRGTGSRR